MGTGGTLLGGLSSHDEGRGGAKKLKNVLGGGLSSIVGGEGGGNYRECVF